MFKKRYALVVAVLMAVLVVVPASAGISGPGSSGVQVQNLNMTTGAAVAVQLWNQNGAAAIDLANDTISAGAAKNYWLPGYPTSTVPNGTYAMVVSADQPVAAIARTDWSNSGGAAIYSSVDPANDITVPLITANYAGQTSQVTIQNTDTTAAATDVELILRGRGLANAVADIKNQTIQKGTSVTYRLSDPMWGSLPNTGVDLGVPNGFVGTLQVKSSKALVVETFIDLANSRGVSGFSGVPTTSAAATLFCPLIRANYYGDTGISIVNPNNSQVSAKITYYADARSPQQGIFIENVTVPANSSVVPFQGVGGSSRKAPTNLPAGSGQTGQNPTPTNNGFFGVAKIEATGGNVLAEVNDTKFGSGWSVQAQSSYNCATQSDAGSTIALPLVRRYHLSNTKLTTGITIQNTTAGQISVHLDLTNWNGTSQAASNPADITIPGWGSGNYWNGFLTNLPSVPASAGGYGWYGSAVLTVTGGTAVVVVNDEGYGTTAVDSANYIGIKVK